jgi:hypothetical protein
MIRAHTQSGQKQQTGGCNPGAVAMVFDITSWSVSGYFILNSVIENEYLLPCRQARNPMSISI